MWIEECQPKTNYVEVFASWLKVTRRYCDFLFFSKAFEFMKCASHMSFPLKHISFVRKRVAVLQLTFQQVDSQADVSR